MADPFVSPAWLGERLEEPDVHPVDVRERWEYDQLGHVPGAVNVPFDEFRSEESDEPGTLPGADAFADLLGEAGLSREDTLVAYDDTNGVFAARFYVTALVYDVADVHILDGDFSAWQQSYEVATEPTSLPAVEVEPRRVPRSESPLVDADEVRACRDDADTVFVDTRNSEEYAAGHLPEAVRFDWTEAVDPETRGIRSGDELRELFADRGITPDGRVVLYCNTARRLSHTFAVLRSIGYDDVAIYEGSLTEWRRIEGELVAEDDRSRD